MFKEKIEKCFQDKNGEWWRQGNGPRYRVIQKQCEFCKNTFFTRKDKNYKRCSLLCSNRMNAPKNPANRKGKDSKHWKGGKIKIGGGYIMILCHGHPTARKNYVLEHRYVMEQYLGRYLTKEETVHHKNGIKHDNRIENLELWTGKHSKGQRVSDLLEWAEELIKIYYKEKNKICHIMDNGDQIIT